MIRRQLLLFFRLFIGIAILLPVATHAQTQSTSRDNPAPFGETVIAGDYEVRVISTMPDALDIVLEDGSSNDPPARGHQFYMVRLELTYIGTETGDPYWDLVYGAVGDTDIGYTDSGSSCGNYPESPHDIGDMFPGAVAEFNICWSIDADDADSLVMYVHELTMSINTGAWLSLADQGTGSTPEADPVAEDSRSRLTRSVDPSPDATPATRGSSTSEQESPTETSRETPAPFGETVVVGDYEVRVISVTPDASDIVLEEHPYNDPPESGHQFYMVRLELTYIGTETGSPFWDIVYGAIGTTETEYSDSGNSCGEYPDSPHDVNDMFPGAVTEMNICWSIDTDDSDSLVMFLEELFSYDDDKVWLSLEPED